MPRGSHPNSRANLPAKQRGVPCPHLNLWRDGFEECAEQIMVRQRRNRVAVVVHVAPDGGVYCGPRTKAPARDDLELVGVYDHRALTEHVEDDLLALLRERSARWAA